MARNMYGATSADFTLTSGGRVVPGATLTIWSARTGGTQITDLLDVDSVATTTVTSDADGSIVYYGPNNDKTVHWADSGVGNRIAIRPVDITGDPPVLSIGTVGTGAAAANLTGTSEAPVLNLTLPSAGANGVNTAAIQNDAVTADKIAANAVGASELADNAVDTAAIADGAVTAVKFAVQPGNLLTANQASGTDTLGDTTGFAVVVGSPIMTSSTEHPLHGSRSLKFVTTETTYWVGKLATSIPVTPGETITIVVGITASVSQTIRLTAYFNTDWASVMVDNIPVGTTPTEMRITAVVPPGVTTLTDVQWQRWEGAIGESFWLDKFGVWRGAGGTWAMPGTPIVGQSHIATNGATHLSGTGSPEGVVTAAPGSTWLQTDATTDVKGWIRWVKATGTGNTGWQAGPEADTGLRNIASIIDADWAPHASDGFLSLRRIGQTVTLLGRLERVTASGTRSNLDPVVTVPTGFVPQVVYRAIGQAVYYVSAAAANIGYLGDVASAARMDVMIPSGGTWAAGDGVFIEASWITADAWPSSLPGSAP